MRPSRPSALSKNGDPVSRSILGAISEEQFLADFWQQKPLLIRDALPGYESPVSPDEMAGLALEDDVESRIVIEAGKTPWELRCGPFDETTFQQLPATHWTLLVQALDLWVPEVAELLDYFRFLPPWRLDDIMASYAPAGGSVGPHFDYYDVFLLQVQGQRRWQVGPLCDQDTPRLEGTPLRILGEFEAVDEWVLNPGDMLYLPPRIAHWGIAENDCLTYSVGFRAPTLADMLGDLATELMAQGSASYYRDPPLSPQMAREDIDPQFIKQVQNMLRQLSDDQTLLADWFARYMTAPKYPDLVEELGEERRANTGGKSYLNGDLLD
ncbi:MAG: cupin domain-containing protein [Gammaproteobacteria bacterium]|nr:MAG: cupin domain-containing protein [Gammaproteobacteria bacterium]